MAKRERRGFTGPPGPTGPRGVHGVKALRGPRVTRTHIVRAVASEFDRLHRQIGEMHDRLDHLAKQLDGQLLRFGQIQEQLDAIHKLLARILNPQ